MFVSLFFGTLFGLLFFNLFTHLQIAVRMGWPQREACLLGSILSIMAYAAATFAEYHTISTDSYFMLIRLQILCEPLFFIFFLEFSRSVSGEARGLGLLLFEVGFIVFALVRELLPYAGIYSQVFGMSPYVLPWGESVYLMVGNPTWVFFLYLLFVIVAPLFGAGIMVRMYRRGGRRESRWMLLAILILIFGICIDIAISADFLRWLYMTEASYVAVTLVASLEVTDEVIKMSSLKKELEHSLAEKMVLLQEVHHRVKNNLQIITSLLSLEAAEPGAAGARAALLDCTDRVHSMYLVHQQLYASENFEEVDFSDYASQLISRLGEAHGLHGDSLCFTSKIEKLKLSVDLAVPLGLILNELASNSLKHAQTGTALALELKAYRSGGMIHFEYADNGPGFAADFDPKRDGGLGMSLIEALSSQVNAAGGFRLDGTGLAYKIKLPAREQKAAQR